MRSFTIIEEMSDIIEISVQAFEGLLKGSSTTSLASLLKRFLWTSFSSSPVFITLRPAMECGANTKVSRKEQSQEHLPNASILFRTVDYILFITAPVNVKANLNEVSEVKWVDADELKDLMTNLDCTSPASFAH
jgi:hypothetical protein